MELFTVIDDADAIIRLPKGVHKQVKVYHRAGKLYVPHGGGFVHIKSKFDDTYSTGHPDVKVIEIDGPGNIKEASNKRELIFTPSPKA